MSPLSSEIFKTPSKEKPRWESGPYGGLAPSPVLSFPALLSALCPSASVWRQQQTVWFLSQLDPTCTLVDLGQCTFFLSQSPCLLKRDVWTENATLVTRGYQNRGREQT